MLTPVLWATHSSSVTLVSSVDGGSFITCASGAPMALVPSLQRRVGKQTLWPDFQLISRSSIILHEALHIYQQRNLDPSPSLSNSTMFNLFLLIFLCISSSSFYKCNILVVQFVHHVNSTLIFFFFPFCKTWCKSYLRMNMPCCKLNFEIKTHTAVPTETSNTDLN